MQTITKQLHRTVTVLWSDRQTRVMKWCILLNITRTSVLYDPAWI